MNTKNWFAFVILAILGITGFLSCKKDSAANKTKAREHIMTINWFRDSTTANPNCFLDLYNGQAHTISTAVLKADSIDLFIFDNSQLIVSSNQLSVINMVFFGDNNYAAYNSFNDVVGVVPFSNYNPSLVSEVSLTPTEFSDITYNEDISSLFESKALSGGYTDITIAASDLSATKYYQFKCAKTNKRGFFRIVNSNYLPAGNMTIEVKVEE